MRLLDAINFILPKLGEHKVTSVDVKHPTLAIILPEIEDATTTILGRGWWFNQFKTKLYPDAEGNINLGADVIGVTPDKQDTAVQRGNRMYNPLTLSYTFTEPVECTVTQYVPFEELPEVCAKYVQYTALIQVYVTDIGRTADVEVWERLAAEAESDLLAEHLRQKRYSTRRSARWTRFTSALRS